jgi:hypothetical protein
MGMWDQPRNRAKEARDVFGGNPNYRTPAQMEAANAAKADALAARDVGFSDKRAKLTPSVVHAAQQAHAANPKANSVAKLAKRYGVARMTMHRAIHPVAPMGRSQRADDAERIYHREKFCAENSETVETGFRIAD